VASTRRDRRTCRAAADTFAFADKVVDFDAQELRTQTARAADADGTNLLRY
jgi:hypothetical protein